MKFKIMRRSIADAEVDQVIDLANWGMSRKLIAKEVYGSDAKDEPSLSSLMRIHYILRDYGIRVTDYRNGRNSNGRVMISAIRREANVLDSIRAAAERATDAVKVKKTGVSIALSSEQKQPQGAHPLGLCYGA